MVRPILAPFDVPDLGLSLVVEDLGGGVLGSAGIAAGEASREATHDIRCGPAKASVGRVVGRGNGIIVDAIVDSVAASLAALASSAHTHEPGGDAAHHLEAELALGRRIQRSLVPLTAPAIPGYEVASHYEAAREVGGDFFDVFLLRTRPARAAIVIADVTGKGIAAALLMAFARPLIRAAIDHAGSPAKALRRTNGILVEERRSSLFITALCAIVELRNGRLRLANAGHEPPLLVPADGSPVRWLQGSGPLLGMFATLDVEECTDELGPGDLALLYTDGVTDSRAATGERFGEDRLLEVVERARGGTARELVSALVVAIADFQGDMPPADDVTIVAIRRDEARPGRLARLRR